MWPGGKERRNSLMAGAWSPAWNCWKWQHILDQEKWVEATALASNPGSSWRPPGGVKRPSPAESLRPAGHRREATEEEAEEVAEEEAEEVAEEGQGRETEGARVDVVEFQSNGEWEQKGSTLLGRTEAEMEANGGSQWHVTVLIENAGRVYIQYANESGMCGASSYTRLSLIERSREPAASINSLRNDGKWTQHLLIISISACVWVCACVCVCVCVCMCVCLGVWNAYRPASIKRE